MYTYLAIGVSVQLAWFIFTIIRNMTSLFDLKGIAEWVGAIFMSVINIMLWPISLITNIIVSYHAELLQK